MKFLVIITMIQLVGIHLDAQQSISNVNTDNQTPLSISFNKSYRKYLTQEINYTTKFTTKCDNYSVKHVENIFNSPDFKLNEKQEIIAGYVYEKWIVQICNSEFVYNVKFTTDPSRNFLSHVVEIQSKEKPFITKHPTFDPLYSVDAPLLVPEDIIFISKAPTWPQYPKLALINQIHGDVLLEIWIDQEGNPTKVNPLWGHQLLKEPATQFCKNLQFKPVCVNNQNSPVRFRFTVPFRLSNKYGYKRSPESYRY